VSGFQSWQVDWSYFGWAVYFGCSSGFAGGFGLVGGSVVGLAKTEENAAETCKSWSWSVVDDVVADVVAVDVVVAGAAVVADPKPQH